MLLYITLGTNDPARARQFYDPVMATLGLIPRDADEDGAGYGAADDTHTRVWIERPFDNKRASHGNGSMIALRAADRACVRAFHAAALAHGGTDEGAPGLRRYGPQFYACYVRDPDGNKLSAVCEDPE